MKIWFRVLRLLLAASCLGLGGCGAGADPIPVDSGTADAGPSCTNYLWEPGTDELMRWPEPDLVIDDADTITGKRLAFDPDRFSTLEQTAEGFYGVFTEGLADVDGFGVTADVFFRFGRAFDVDALPSMAATDADHAGAGLVVFGASPSLRSVLVSTTDEGATLLLTPAIPLPPKARAAAFVTRAWTAAAGGCLEPSPGQATVLASPDADTQQAIDVLVALGVITDADDLVALVVFPTQSITDDSELVAAAIDAQSFEPEADPVCVDETTWIHCELTFEAGDYRDDDGVIRREDDGELRAERLYSIPVSVYLPPTASAPFPTLLYGHGLGSGRDQAERLAAFAAAVGFATVAIDAVEHGQHPDNDNPDAAKLTVMLEFFGITLDAGTGLDALVLRDNFRQSTYDKLQATRLLLSGLDLDADGSADLDPDRLAYLGVSLGGIMGPELASLTDAYRAVVLVVPGGRLASIISDSDMFSVLVDVVRPAGVTDGDVDRFFPILQTVLDRADPDAYAVHMFENRLLDDSVVSVLVGAVLDDDTVPNVSTWALARALGVPIVPPVLREVPGLDASTEPPLSGNMLDGLATAGLLEFDVIREDGEVKTATHSNVGDSEVGTAAWLSFLRSELNGPPAIIDPYAATGLEH